MSLLGKLKRLIEPVTGHYTAPGSPVRLRKPPDFEVTEAFPGLIHPATGASIMVQVIPGPYDQISPGFTADALMPRGIAMHEDEPVEIDGRPGRLLRLSQPAGGIDYDKWALMLDDGGRTVLVMATYPAAAALEVSERLRGTLLEASFHDDDATAKGPGFQIGQSPLLKAAGAWGGMAIATPDGRFVPGEPGEAIFLAGWGLQPIVPGARRRFATEHIGQVDGDLLGISVTTQREIELDGLAGFETQAVGRSRVDGLPRVVYETMLFAEDRYVVMAGFTAEALALTYVPAFQQLALGFRR